MRLPLRFASGVSLSRHKMNNTELPSEMRPPARRRRGAAGWVVVGALAVAVGGALWLMRDKLGWGPASGPAASAPGGGSAAARRFGGANRAQPVSVQRVRNQDLHVTVQAIGTLTAANTATVRAQVSGVLQALAFKEGQPVRAGQLLAQIDPRAFQATLAQAEGTLARDKAQLDNARVDLARYQDLLATDAIARQQVDTQAALVHQLEGAVRADEANVASARLQLSYTRITAPISGRAGLKQVDLGNVVAPNDTNGLVVIAQTQPMALVFAVPSAQLGAITERLRSGAPLPVEVLDRGGQKRLAVGRVASVDNAIDISTDTVRLKALFDNRDDALYPNQSVSVRLQVATVEDALVVPSAALLRGTQGFYVWVVGDDGSVAARTVTPGETDGSVVAVSGALRGGERIVVDGVDRLRDGAKVEVIAADPAQRQGASAPAGGGRAGGARDLPPELREKLRTMSPDERRAFFEKMRAQRGPSGAASGVASAASR